MIKKYGSYFIRYILAILILSIYVIEPMGVKAAAKANTLAQLREQLADLQAQKKKNDSQKQATQSEIDANNAAILNAKNKISESQTRIEEAKVLIASTDKKISELQVQTKELMAYFQIMQGENNYMEFVTDSSSMTELIMRLDAVRQLANYNQNKLVELNDLIEENEQLQVDLIKYEKELQNNIVTYETKVSTLQYDLSDLGEIGADIDQEIRSKKELIDTYVKMGCKEDQDLDECASVAGTVQWYKPLAKGRVNSIFGLRIDPINGGKKIHRAVDIGGNSEGTAVYSAANGLVVATVDARETLRTKGKKTCGGNQVYIQVMVAGKRYTIQYAHLLTINVKVGESVTFNTVIGTQGGGSKTASWESCSTGSHLHFGVVEGAVKVSAMADYFNTYAVVPPGFPGQGGWFYSRTQWFS